jgi:hypothetical protein
MELRTIAILCMMAFIVVATSAFGTYQDSVGSVLDNKKVAKAKVQEPRINRVNPNWIFPKRQTVLM